MITEKIQRLIAQYLNKQATLSEQKKLDSWLKTPNNLALFKKYIKTNYLINLNINTFNADDSKKQLLELIAKEKKVIKIRRYTRFMKYASIFVIFLGLGYLYQVGHFSKSPKVTIPPNSVTLELGNGSVKILNEDGRSQITDNQGNIVGKQTGEQLIYDNEAEVEELVYNTLTVPFGKRFQLQLSDGTNVHLNAGSSLKYPVKFIDNNKRQVFLVGEAFFDVASDKKNPFIVNAKKLNVRVLGTTFNVSAYLEDAYTDVVLVEGSVGLYTDKKTSNQAITIQPGTKARLNKNLGKITTKMVDIAIYTSWMEGSLIFRNMPFENIVKKLERHYNIKIIIANKKLQKEIFSANFKEKSSIEKILISFGNSYGIKYTVKDNTIFIN